MLKKYYFIKNNTNKIIIYDIFFEKYAYFEYEIN